MIKIRPVSDLRNKFPEIEDIVVREGEPVYLTKNGYGSMVVLSLEKYAELTDDIELKLDIADREADSNDVRYTHEEVFSRMRIDNRLKRLERGGQASAEISRNFDETDRTGNENAVAPASGNLEHTWRKVLDIIKPELIEVSFKTWLEIIVPLSIDKDVIRLEVPSEFDKGIIECRYSALLKTALRSITNRDFELEFSVTGVEKKEEASNIIA